MAIGIPVAVPPSPSDSSESVEFELDRQQKQKLQLASDSTPTPTNPVGGANGFNHLSAEGLHHLLSFLSLEDRAALLTTNKRLAVEPLATSIQSFCGSCAQCEAHNEHLCETPTLAVRNQQFWSAALRRTSSNGFTALRLAGDAAFPACIVASTPTATLHRAFSSLRVLDLNRCSSLDPPTLLRLAATCTGLQELRFRDMALDTDAFALLITANHATLRVVDLEGCHTLTGRDIRSLTSCKRLEKLSLAGCHGVDNAAIGELVRACGRLESLNLRFCHQIDDLLVEKIANSLPRLEELNLRYCRKITDAAVRVLADKLPQLTTLDLSQCAKLTDAAVGHIVGQLKALRSLRLWACSKLTSAAVQAISEAAPALELVDLRSRDRLDPVIGGRDGLQLLARKRSRRWEPSDQLGVFKRLPTCAVAA